MPTDQSYYNGEFRDDKFHGVGSIKNEREGFTFHGIFNNGKASKIGKLETKTYEYIGEIEDLKKMHGCGIKTDLQTKKKYEGEFEDDIPMGKGRIIYPNGDVYTGETDKMNKQGAGRLEYKNEKGKYFIG